MRAGDEPQRLSLEVRLDRQPIEGRLYRREGQLVRAFSGWLGLMAAIEAAAVDGARPECEPEPLTDR